MSDATAEQLSNAIEAANRSTAAAEAGVVKLEQDRVERKKSLRILMGAVVFGVLVVILGTLGTWRTNTVANDNKAQGAVLIKLAKQNKALTEQVAAIATATHKTSVQVDCAFQVARQHPALTNNATRSRLTDQCIERELNAKLPSTSTTTSESDLSNQG